MNLAQPHIKHYINLISLCCVRGDVVLAEHYLEMAAGLDPSHGNLAQARQTIQRKKQDLNNIPFSFENVWSLPEINYRVEKA